MPACLLVATLLIDEKAMVIRYEQEMGAEVLCRTKARGKVAWRLKIEFKRFASDAVGTRKSVVLQRRHPDIWRISQA